MSHRPYRTLLLAMTAVAVVFPSSLAVADVAPSFPQTQREYFVEALDEYPDHTFFIVHVPLHPRGTYHIHELKDGELVPLSRQRRANSYLYAVSGDLPEEVTKEWLDDADALSVQVTRSFRRLVRSVNDDRNISLERITYKVAIHDKDEDADADADDDATEGEKEGDGEDGQEPQRRSLFGDPPSDLRVVGQTEGPLQLIPARFVRLDSDREVLLERNLLSDEDGDEEGEDGASSKSGSNRAARNSGVLIFASGFGVLMLLGLVALRRLRDE